MAGRSVPMEPLGPTATHPRSGLSPTSKQPRAATPGNGGGNPPPGAGEHPTLALIGRGLRPTSAAIYRRDVADFLRWLGRPPEEATSADIAGYLAGRAVSPSSSDRRLAALAHFYRAGIDAADWTIDPTAGTARARRGGWR